MGFICVEINAIHADTIDYAGGHWHAVQPSVQRGQIVDPTVSPLVAAHLPHFAGFVDHKAVRERVRDER